MLNLLFYKTGLLLSFVTVFFKPPFLKSQMELSKAPRCCDFGGADVFWAGSWDGVEGVGAVAWGGGGIEDEPVGKKWNKHVMGKVIKIYADKHKMI